MLPSLRNDDRLSGLEADPTHVDSRLDFFGAIGSVAIAVVESEKLISNDAIVVAKFVALEAGNEGIQGMRRLR
jgi:hypothetical protein